MLGRIVLAVIIVVLIIVASSEKADAILEKYN
ncbi:hypothetical protein FHS15_004044 [Paenibacillus castaneae]|nr:hypothetical protein [Paenibacillus castaneae]